MKPQKAVLRETVHIAIGVIVMTALTVIVESLINGFSGTIVFGGLLGCVTAVGNFFLLGMTVQGAVVGIQGDDVEAAQRAKAKMQFSYSTRMLAVFVLEVVYIAVLKLDAIAALLPLLFPRITIFIMSIMNKMRKEEN